jgi:hypothetical protein
MWPLVAIGVGAWILKELFDEEEEDDEPKRKKRKPKKKKVFISFAIEDQKYRDFLVAQARNWRSPFSFTDMSVKEPWDEAVWKRRCREKIRDCDGVIALVSKNTWKAGGARWEIRCAREEGIRVLGMHIKKYDKAAKLPELEGCRVYEWSWENLDEMISRF